MEIREIRSLVVFAECESIQETAEKCNLSPPAVHKHLKMIADEFGVSFYSKRGGRLELTDAGRLLLPFAREIMLRHDAASTALREWRDAAHGLVRVGAGPCFTSCLLPILVKRFRRCFPKVELFVETATGDRLLERLSSGHLDLIFDLGAQAVDVPGVDTLARWESPAGFVSARSDVPNPCRLAQLKKAPFILYEHDSWIERIIHSYFNRLGFSPKVVMRSDSAEAIKAFVRSGLGVSVLFLWNINSEPRGSPMTVLRTDAPPLTSDMALLKMRTRLTSPAVRAFIELSRCIKWKNLHPSPGLALASGRVTDR